MRKSMTTYPKVASLIGLVLVAMLLLAACSSPSQSSQSGGNVPATGGTLTQMPTTASAGTTPSAAATGGATMAATGAATVPASGAATSAATGAATAATTPAAGTAGTTSATMTAPSQLALKVANDAKLGSFLTDEKGMTLYTFAKDTAGTSNCTGQCLANWPALLVVKGGQVTLTGGDQSQVGTITRPDGTTQVTYKNMPLYYFAKDKNPGETNGQGIGSVWFVAKP